MNKSYVLSFSACVVTFLLSCFSLQSFAQEPVPSDTGAVFTEDVPLEPVPQTDGEEISDMPVETVETDTLGPVPGIAAFYSAVLPGLGQAYNNSHWKIPIIYGGAAFLGWFINDQHKRYSASRQNLELIVNNPDTPTVRGDNLEQWNRRVEGYRRQRDYFIIISGVLYMLNIVEAYTDAHLQDFNVSDDLALQFKPSIMAMPGGQAGAGFALTLHIQ